MGQNGREIPNLEFENQGFLENQDFLPNLNPNVLMYKQSNLKIKVHLLNLSHDYHFH